MDGVLNLLKPSGPTSHDMVDEVRRLLGVKKVGHAGTLDPMAGGVLVVCVGKAVKISEFLVGFTKTYLAGIRFGVSTNTQDITGEVVEEVEASRVTESDFAHAAAGFVGDIQQVPPMVSAVKHNGQRLYKLARAGVTVERKPRSVRIYSINVQSFVSSASPEGVFEVVCSSGTYIRTLCADIGTAIGCPASMSSLVRNAVGDFGIASSVSIDTLRAAVGSGKAEQLLIPITDAISYMPRIELSDADVELVIHGRSLAYEVAEMDSDVNILLVDESGLAVAVGKVIRDGDISRLTPAKVFV